MPVKRRVSKMREHRITDECVDLWRLIREIEDAGLDDTWEEDGGRKRECLDASVKLHSMLGLFPHEPQLEDVTEPEPPDYERFPDSWRRAWELRQQLEGMI